MDTLRARDLQEIDLSVHPSSSLPFGMFEENESHNLPPNSSQQQLASNAHTSTSPNASSNANNNNNNNLRSNSNRKNNLCRHWSSVTWKKFTPIQKILLITLTITICALIACVILQFVFNFAKYPGICNTSGCIYESANILQNLNTSIDPCDDFYTFTCDGFIKRHQIPQDKSRFNTFDIIRDEVDTIIYDLFTKHQSSTSSTSFDSSSITPSSSSVKLKNKPTEPLPLSFIRSLYLGCINETYLESLSFNPLNRYFNYILKSLAISTSSTSNSIDRQSLLLALTLGDSLIVSISILPNPFNTSQFAVQLDAPSFGIDRMDLISEDDRKAKNVVEAYKKYIESTFEMLNVNQNTRYSKGQLVNEIISFETKLARVATPPEVRRNHRETIKKMSFQQLELVSPFKWVNLLNDLINLTEATTKITLNSFDDVIINDLPYISNLTLILEQTDPVVSQYYLVWRLIQSVGFMSTSQFRKVESTFLKTQQGTQKSPPLKERCSDLLRNTVPSLIGRIFVDGEFSENDKSIALEIIKDVLDAFVEMVDEKDWIDEQTKRRSIAKAKAMKINIGYPDWIKNDTDIERVYNFTLKSPGLTGDTSNETSLDMVWRMKRCSMRDQLSKLGTKVDSEYEWPMSPALVNAAYDPTQNTITFPAAILRGVYFNASRPKYSNYAGIGSIIGHEITHGFDDEGAQYDENGNLVNWWTNETLIQFQNKSQCLIDQYASIHDKVVDMDLNGKSTLGENIADCGGIREAYRAYFNRYSLYSEPILPNLTNFTSEQLLFIAHGNNWCGNIRPEKLRQVIQTDPHAPSKYRANLPLSNFDQFARAFNCKPNTTMNPTNKCVLW